MLLLRIEWFPFDIAVSGRFGARLAGVGLLGDGGKTPGDDIRSNGAALLRGELGRESDPLAECCSSIRNSRGNVSGNAVRKSLVVAGGSSMSLVDCFLGVLRFVSCAIRRCHMSKLSWQWVAKRVNSSWRDQNLGVQLPQKSRLTRDGGCHQGEQRVGELANEEHLRVCFNHWVVVGRRDGCW